MYEQSNRPVMVTYTQGAKLIQKNNTNEIVIQRKIFPNTTGLIFYLSRTGLFFL